MSKISMKTLLKINGVFILIFAVLVAISDPERNSKPNRTATPEEVAIQEQESLLMQVAYNRIKRAGLPCNTVEDYTIRNNHRAFLACDGYNATYTVEVVKGVIEINDVKYYNM